MTHVQILDQLKAIPPSKLVLAAGVAAGVAGAGFVWSLTRRYNCSVLDALRLVYIAEHKLLETVLTTATEGDPQSVLSVIDKFGMEHWMMNVGDEKGTTLDEAIQQHTPGLMVELGAYCGYSAVRSARLLAPGAQLVSIEFNALCSAIATKVVEHAGLGDRVRVLHGNVESALPRLRAIMDKRGAAKVDLIFIDHEKTVYLSDLRRLEQAGVIRKGTVIVADNVIVPGAPDYLEYVRSAPHYQSRFVPGWIEYQSVIKDGIEVSVCIADPVV